METKRETVGVRKCPKCGSVWYTALPKCAFCGIEGEEIKGPISPSKLNLGRGGVTSAPAPKDPAPEPAAAPAAAPAAPAPVPPPSAAAAEAPAPDPPREKAVEPAPAPAPPPPPVEAAPPVPVPVESRAPVPGSPVEKKERLPLRSEGLLGKPAMAREPRQEERGAPAPAAPVIPSATVPLVCGFLGILACLGLPAMIEIRHDRVLGVLALLAWALLAPLGPAAWFTAQRYAERCHALGFRPSPTAATGKVLGMTGTFLVTLEFSAIAVFVAVQVLSGRITELPWK